MGLKAKNRIQKKLKSKKGFTLVELMCATLIMVIVAGIMVLGISLGVRTYNDSLAASEAKSLCSVVCETINDELGESGTIYTQNGKLVGLTSKSFGGGTYKELKMFFIGSDGQLYYGNDEKSLQVLGSKVYGHGMKLNMTISLATEESKKSNIFTVNIDVKDSQDNVLASSTFDVKQLNYHTPIDVATLT